MVDITGLTIIIATAVIFSLIGILYAKRKKISVEDFISARNSVKLPTAIATLVASSMGVWILFSPAETAVTSGITALIGYSIGSAFALFIFAWIGSRIRSLMPKGHTITEYVFLRYGKGMYILILFISVFYMAVFLAAELTGISLAAKLVFNIPLIFTAFIVGIGTLAYTAFGGIKATIFTDRIQSIVILPLLAIIFLASLFFLGGFTDVINKADKINPDLFNFSYFTGIEFALTLIIAIIGAELFNQGNWQRVYGAKNSLVMKKAFLIAGFIVLPIIFFIGFFGFFAVDSGTADHPSVAMFEFLLEVTPKWILLTAMVLGIALVMSSMDTLLNGLVSLFTIDLARLKPRLSHNSLLSIGKWFTVILAGLAILVSTKGYSVLYLFLVADLVCVGAAFPTFYGMYTRRFSGVYALVASVIGIAIGSSIFPNPSFTAGIFFPNYFNLFWSFFTALITSTIISVIFGFYSKKFKFKILKKSVLVSGQQ
jgi:Na+/proline symporter